MHWYHTQEVIELQTPSRNENIDFETEARYRKEGARFIMELGNKLGLRYLTMATGIVFYHRFYMFHSFKEFSRWVTGATCLFLAGKVEETPKKCRDILKVAQQSLSDHQFKTFGENPREEVMICERILLQTIKFDLQLNHPYQFLIKFGKLLKGDKSKINELVQKAWIFINDSLSTTLCLMYKPEVVALAVLLLAFKLSNQNIRDLMAKPRVDWWKEFYAEADEKELEEICKELMNMYEGKPPKRRFPNSHIEKIKSGSQANSPQPPGSPQIKKQKLSSSPLPITTTTSSDTPLTATPIAVSVTKSVDTKVPAKTPKKDDKITSQQTTKIAVTTTVQEPIKTETPSKVTQNIQTPQASQTKQESVATTHKKQMDILQKASLLPLKHQQLEQQKDKKQQEMQQLVMQQQQQLHLQQQYQQQQLQQQQQQQQVIQQQQQAIQQQQQYNPLTETQQQPHQQYQYQQQQQQMLPQQQQQPQQPTPQTQRMLPTTQQRQQYQQSLQHQSQHQPQQYVQQQQLPSQQHQQQHMGTPPVQQHTMPTGNTPQNIAVPTQAPAPILDHMSSFFNQPFNQFSNTAMPPLPGFSPFPPAPLPTLNTSTGTGQSFPQQALPPFMSHMPNPFIDTSISSSVQNYNFPNVPPMMMQPGSNMTPNTNPAFRGTPWLPQQ